MKHKIVHILLLFLFANHANSQSLNDYLVIAAENNPNLKAHYFRYQAALEKVPQVGALPDPQLSFGFFVMPMERYMGNQIAEFSFMQMFPWFGALGAAKNEMTFMAKAKFEEFNETKSMLFYEVRTNWYALLLLEKEVAITKENIELLKTMEQISLTRFKSGGGAATSMDIKSENAQKNARSSSGMGSMDMASANQTDSKSANQTIRASTNGGSMIDVLRVQMEINELQNNLELLEDSKTPLVARFNQLLNRERTEIVLFSDTIIAAEIPIALNEIPDSIINNNPMLKMLEQEEEAYIEQGKMNQKRGLPMIGVGLQYGVFRPRDNNPSMMNGQNMLMPMATVTIPLWRKKYTASVKESDFLRQSVVEQKNDVSNLLMVNYEDAIKEYNDANRRVRLYQNQTTLANQTLNLLIVQYSIQGSNFEEVLRMQQQLLDYRVKLLDALIDGNMAVAMMEKLMGR